MTRAIASLSRPTGASRRRLAALASLWLLAGQFGAAQFASHTRLEVNMGYLNFGSSTAVLYSDQQSTTDYPAMSSYCGSAMYRSCIQQILASYHSQGITGVRFQFDLYHALNGTQVNPYWLQGLSLFFADLHAHSIYNVTPTLGWVAADPGQYVIQTNVPPRAAEGCSSYPTYAQMRFSPTAPYGEWYNSDTGKWDVTEQLKNDAYKCAPANPSFVGWTAIYSAVNAMLQAASSNGLTVTELDLQNETALHLYTVYARLIVDNTHSDEPVLTNLRQAMSAHGFDPGKVTYSVSHVAASTQLTNPPRAYDCGSAYGDSARILDVSELLSAIDGMWFGHPFGVSAPYTLECGGTIQNDAYLPIGQPSPTIIDMHDSPCVGNCDPNVWSWSTVTLEATTDFNALDTFRESFYPLSSCPARSPGCGWRTQCCGYDPNLANALIVIGETFGYTRPNDTPVCPMTDSNGNPENPPHSWSRAAAVNMVTGFNQSWLQGVTLPNGTYGYVVFRPGEYLQFMPYGTWTASEGAACNPVVVNSNSIYTPTN